MAPVVGVDDEAFDGFADEGGVTPTPTVQPRPTFPIRPLTGHGREKAERRK